MNNIKLTKEECKRWIDDLRSGKYKQGVGRLRSKNQYGEYFCCLGVLKETQGKPEHSEHRNQLLSPKIISRETQDTLAKMNDAGKSFLEIADHIERYMLPKRN